MKYLSRKMALQIAVVGGCAALLLGVAVERVQSQNSITEVVSNRDATDKPEMQNRSTSDLSSLSLKGSDLIEGFVSSQQPFHPLRNAAESAMGMERDFSARYFRGLTELRYRVLRFESTEALQKWDNNPVLHGAVWRAGLRPETLPSGDLIAIGSYRPASKPQPFTEHQRKKERKGLREYRLKHGLPADTETLDTLIEEMSTPHQRLLQTIAIVDRNIIMVDVLHHFEMLLRSKSVGHQSFSDSQTQKFIRQISQELIDRAKKLSDKP